jgi:glutamine synthetase
MLEQLYKNKRLILKKSQEFFLNSSSLTPKIGCELEFFLLEKNLAAVENQALMADLISELKSELTKKYSLIYQVEKEQGVSQVEVKTSFTSDLFLLCEQLESAKNFIKNFAQEKNFIASFVSQPFVNDCGSALQFNVSPHGKDDKNIFELDKNFLKNSATSLLKMTNSMMIFLAPKEEDYTRFSFDLNRELFRKGKFTAPINLSFGADNRTCAIRIPNPSGNRLEYRIAAADADPALAISAILIAISSDQKTNEPQFEQIFGNAFDEKYKLENFCQSLKEAEGFFAAEENFIRKKFSKFLAIKN